MPPKVKPDPIDPLYENMNYNQIQSEIESLKLKLNDLKNKRNFVQQERDLIKNYYDISILEETKLRDEIEKQANLIEKNDTNHNYDIAGFSNKYQHLEFDHEQFQEKTLTKNNLDAVAQEDQIAKDREEIYFNDKRELKNKLKIDTIDNIKQIDNEKLDLKKKFENIKSELDTSLINVKNRYDEKIKNLESDLELRLKIEIHELEERKNLHISFLVKSFEDRMKHWKDESIAQIRENINLIKTNTENYEALVLENKNLTDDEKALDKDIAELTDKLAKSKEKHSQIMNKLAKYYNQEINLKNMKSKINSLKQKSKDTEKKSAEVFLEKELLMSEIGEIISKYQLAIGKFKERSEYKNILIENHLNSLNEKYDLKENEIEELLKNVDMITEKDGLSRENIKNFMDDIRNILITKSKIIKSLKYSIIKATKASFFI